MIKIIMLNILKEIYIKSINFRFCRFPIRDFSLYLYHIFLHGKSIQPNLNAIENKIIPDVENL
ncbi:hypothetical protein AR685_13635 [Chryseobacterium sp. JAH]|nr:hypothetical protein AR685_13635 [Chryseobacterium sp. JAH]